MTDSVQHCNLSWSVIGVQGHSEVHDLAIECSPWLLGKGLGHCQFVS